MCWTSQHQSMSTYSQPSFSTSTWKRGWVWMCKLGDICRINWHNNGWPWVTLNGRIKSTSSASCVNCYLCASWACFVRQCNVACLLNRCRYEELNVTKSLKDSLVGRMVIEHPTLHICTSQNHSWQWQSSNWCSWYDLFESLGSIIRRISKVSAMCHTNVL